MPFTRKAVVFVLVFALAGAVAFAAEEAAGEQAAVALPKPQTEGGMPLMQALKARHTTREFDAKALGDQVLSNLLWAAFGVNREDGKRTAPSAMNWQEIDIYVAKADGLFLYDAKANALKPILAEDIRGETGRQPFVATAPITLILVSDYAKMGTRASAADKDFYTACDTGFIAQNVYLFCASESLNCVVRGGLDRESLSKTMKLRDDQKIMLCQNVGHPKTQ